MFKFVALPIIFLFLQFFSQDIYAQDTMFDHFISRSGSKLMDDIHEFRFISWNIPNLNFVEDEMAFTREHEFGLPTAYEIRDALESVKQLGGTVVRTYTIPVRAKTDVEGVPKYVLAPGKFDERSFMTMDTMMTLANEMGIRLIIPLLNAWQWMGGRPQYADFRGKTQEEFWTDPQLIADFKKTIKYVLNRKNSITGISYKNDKAILCWETGNELPSPPSWTKEIAAYIKKLDKNHLVMHGGWVNEETLNDPNVDIVTSHHYSDDPTQLFGWIHWILDMIKARKPYIIGEFGFSGTQAIEKLLDWVIEKEISGALIWSLRYHRHQGGFYWHSEPFGRGVFKAYHWPGFNSGNEYDEKNLLAVMRKKSYEIRGLPVPAVPVPKSPFLLPVQTPAAISWRGSTGAAAYDVQRSENQGGPWITIGFNISDAAVQYMPLFQDETAEIGHTYYYRVFAKNESGESSPSNIVGPVYVKYQAWIDEMGTFTRLFFKKGDWTINTKNCRKFKEDAERFAGNAGSTLIYRVPGPITGWKIYSFTQDTVQNLTVSVFSDKEKTFKEVKGDIISMFIDSGDYDYWRPVLYQYNKMLAGVKYLKLQIKSKSQIARVEIYYGKDE
jgi:mannan endo-1,4-beta-mannosidase